MSQIGIDTLFMKYKNADQKRKGDTNGKTGNVDQRERTMPCQMPQGDSEIVF
jgi:hypothetical protein